MTQTGNAQGLSFLKSVYDCSHEHQDRHPAAPPARPPSGRAWRTRAQGSGFILDPRRHTELLELRRAGLYAEHGDLIVNFSDSPDDANLRAVLFFEVVLLTDRLMCV